jgi:hypothetical protein
MAAPRLAPGVALGDAVELIHKTEAQMHFPDSLRGSFQGTAQAFKSSTSSQPWLILAALLTVYLVLGMLYESLIHPITILSTLPSAGVGALLALFATKTEFSIIALIGIILLIGIVKKNAIILVDFAIESRRIRGRRRHRIRATPAPRYRHGGRTLPLASGDPVHDPGHLPLARPHLRAPKGTGGGAPGIAGKLTTLLAIARKRRQGSELPVSPSQLLCVLHGRVRHY